MTDVKENPLYIFYLCSMSCWYISLIRIGILKIAGSIFSSLRILCTSQKEFWCILDILAWIGKMLPEKSLHPLMNRNMWSIGSTNDQPVLWNSGTISWWVCSQGITQSCNIWQGTRNWMRSPAKIEKEQEWAGVVEELRGRDRPRTYLHVWWDKPHTQTRFYNGRGCSNGAAKYVLNHFLNDFLCQQQVCY